MDEIPEKIKTDVKKVCETATSAAEALAKLHTFYPSKGIKICEQRSTGATVFCIPGEKGRKTTVCCRFKS